MNNNFYSVMYKLVVNKKIVAEGSKKEMIKLAKKTPGSFVGVGSPKSQLGQSWN